MYPLDNGYDQQHDKQNHCDCGAVAHLVILECRGIYVINQGIGRASGTTLRHDVGITEYLEAGDDTGDRQENVVGFSKGTVILKNFWIGFAPSISAASYRSLGSPVIAALYMNTRYPRLAQMTTSMIEGSAHS